MPRALSLIACLSFILVQSSFAEELHSVLKKDGRSVVTLAGKDKLPTIATDAPEKDEGVVDDGPVFADFGDTNYADLFDPIKEFKPTKMAPDADKIRIVHIDIDERILNQRDWCASAVTAKVEEMANDPEYKGLKIWSKSPSHLNEGGCRIVLVEREELEKTVLGFLASQGGCCGPKMLRGVGKEGVASMIFNSGYSEELGLFVKPNLRFEDWRERSEWENPPKLPLPDTLDLDFPEAISAKSGPEHIQFMTGEFPQFSGVKVHGKYAICCGQSSPASLLLRVDPNKNIGQSPYSLTLDKGESTSYGKTKDTTERSFVRVDLKSMCCGGDEDSEGGVVESGGTIIASPPGSGTPPLLSDDNGSEDEGVVPSDSAGLDRSSTDEGGRVSPIPAKGAGAADEKGGRIPPDELS